MKSISTAGGQCAAICGTHGHEEVAMDTHARVRRVGAQVLLGALLASLLLVAIQRPARVAGASPPESTFFSTYWVDEYTNVNTSSDGDLWANCWSDDDNVYASNGDGKGFGSTAYDVAVNRISGSPAPTNTLAGVALAGGSQVGSIWASGPYSRKPTGMLCVNGELYLAIQDLYTNGDDVPNASISKSTDHGQTWTWNTSSPMFSNHVFTTIFFLDYGKNNVNDPDPNYVYAYGLDNNWRTSFTRSVPDPVDLYLARIPKTSIQNASTWQWSTGANTWSAPGAISQRIAVLHDDRRIYQTLYSTNVHNLSVLAQGSVVYNQPLNRYLYTSWTEYTFEFYEAPNPWGPWSHFMTKDFGGYQWTSTKNGGYATTIPSKFISADGRTMWVQSNVCSCGGGGISNYDFTLRKLSLVPYSASTASNGRSDTTNLARTSGTQPIERVAHLGNVAYYNDGITTNQSEDDWNDENKTQSWWGYIWPVRYNLNRAVFTSGNMFSDGGWFASGLTVQVRQNFQWVNVTGLSSYPALSYSNADGPNKTFTLNFNDTWGDGIRVIGTPGGTKTFTSIGELAAYYGSANLVADPGFENQTSSTISAPWSAEGPDTKGIDIRNGLSHTGLNNAWIHPTATGSTNWNAIKQVISLQPNTNYTLTGFIQNSGNFSGGYFGVRNGTTTNVLREVQYGALGPYTQLTVSFNSGSNTTVTVYAGYWAPGVDSWIRLDDVTIT
jgi:hypothetical protein